MGMSIQENKFMTKQDYTLALETIIEPLKKGILESEIPGLHLGSSGAIYNQQRADMEALVRPLWGLAPLWTFKKDALLRDAYLEKIVQGTDPTNPLYWGEIQDYDQYIVETAALSLTILVHKDYFWDALSNEGRKNLSVWLAQVLDKKIPKNNWTFFKILVRIALFSCGEPLNKEALEEELNLVNSMYIGEGWYVDGKSTQKDYYIPFAFHYYGLLYATFMQDIDPKWSQLFIERATLFAQDFQYYFDTDGEALPFGRSATYRFAQVAFFSALVFADVEAIPWGEMKTMISSHLKSWMGKEIFTFDGRLSIGYHYENLVMAEGYNAPGSPYWGVKAFLLLAVPADHPFWQAPLSLTQKDSKKLITKGNMLLLHNQSGSHLLGYPAGLMVEGQAHGEAKYSKFVYSTKFGFSVPKAGGSYEEGAFDNTLAVSCDQKYYRTKRDVSAYQINETCICYQWSPFSEVSIVTEIYPFGEWHLRVHDIETEVMLDVWDGGFSVPLVNKNPNGVVEKEYAYVEEGDLVSRIDIIDGYEKAAIIRPEVNTSLFFPRTTFPALHKKLPPGKHRLMCLVGGIATNQKG